MKSRPKVASVGGIAGTFPARKFEPLLKLGLDITLFLYRQCSFPAERATLARYRSRVKYLPKKRSGWKSRVRHRLLLLRRALLCPGRTLRLIAAALRRHGLTAKARGSVFRLLPFLGQGFDLVHLEDGWLAQELLDLILFKDILGVKVIVSFRGADLFVNSLINTEICRTILQASDDSHFVSEALLRRARELGLPPTKGRVIPPGIEPHVFEPSASPRPDRPSPEDGLRLLSIGRLDWGKGYEYGLKVISIIAERGMKVRYDIVGEGRLYEALRYAVWQMGLEGVAHLHGRLGRDEFLPLMHQAHIYIQPAVREGFGNAVLEAQSFGLPVVCTDAGGLPEAVEDGVTGFVVPARDPQALAEKTIALAQDAELRARMGEQGRRRVLANFTLEQQAARFLEFYRDVAGRQQHAEEQ